MRVYCYKCKSCGARFEAPADQEVFHYQCCGNMQISRDYKAESVGIGPAIGNIRRDFATTDKANENARHILPSGDDFLKKHKGDRKKANAEIRDWNARHEPADSKGNVYRPQEV